MTRQHTILFDIDGTLIRTGGAGMLAINHVFQERFGFENRVEVPVRGRTDFGIFGDLFRANQICFEDHYRDFSARYHELLPSYLVQSKGGAVLPCVESLLEELVRSEFRLGIITGNARTAAIAKLNHFGLDSYFAFGGYGDDSENRDDVARAAVASAIEHTGAEFDVARCWVIGDTPADVTCAQSVGARSIAVLTGGYGRNDFSDCGPDLMFESLSELSCKELLKTCPESS